MSSLEIDNCARSPLGCCLQLLVKSEVVIVVEMRAMKHVCREVKVKVVECKWESV